MAELPSDVTYISDSQPRLESAPKDVLYVEDPQAATAAASPSPGFPEAQRVLVTVDALYKLALTAAKSAVKTTADLGALLRVSLSPPPLEITDEMGTETPSLAAPPDLAKTAIWQVHEIRDAIRYLGDISDLISKSTQTTKLRLESLETNVAVYNAEIGFAKQTLAEIERVPLAHLTQLWAQLEMSDRARQAPPSEIAALLATESQMRQERKEMLSALEQKSSEIMAQVSAIRDREAGLLRSVEPLVGTFGQICETLEA